MIGKGGKNGIIFNSGNYKQLSEKIAFVIKNKDLMHKMIVCGKKTVNNLWSPNIAAERLIKVSKALIFGYKIPYYKYGPMKCLNKA